MSRLTTTADLDAAISWRLRSTTGSMWSFVCAKQAQDAKVAGVVDIFWSAGFEVLAAYRASQRGQVVREGDALSKLLAQFFANNHKAPPAEAYDHCLVLAEMRASPFCDFGEAGGLLYEPVPGAALVDIGMDAFLQRARRAQKKARAAAVHEHVDERRVV